MVQRLRPHPSNGGVASSIVGGAATSAATAVLPIAAATALGVSLPVFLLLRKKTVSFQKGSSLDSLANIVGEFIFLPMLAKYNDVLAEKPSAYNFARQSATERICEWGYHKEYAENLIDKYLNKVSANELTQLFNTYLTDIDKLGKKELYKGICTKSEVPPKGIQKIANKLADDVMPNQKAK